MTTRKIVPSLLAMMALAAVAAAANPPRFVVRDATGAVAGVILGQADDAAPYFGGGLMWIARPVAGTPLKILVDEKGPFDTARLKTLLYESDDCSGTALMATPVSGDDPHDAVVFGNYVYWPEGSGVSRTVRSQASLVMTADDCTATLVAPQVCCTRLQPGVSRATAPVVSLPLTGLSLAPPFRVEPDSGNP